MEMNTADKEALTAAIAQAEAAGGKGERSEAATALNEAVAAANTSHAYYVELDRIIQKGMDALALDKANGQEKLNMAIRSAQMLKESGNADEDKVKTADYIMDDAIFAYNVLNGSGTDPEVTTGEVIVGSRAMVGRLSTRGADILESGFCWAEHPDPMVLDAHTSYHQSCDETNWSPVYVMYDIDPSTELWVRAYSFDKTYTAGVWLSRPVNGVKSSGARMAAVSRR